MTALWLESICMLFGQVMVNCVVFILDQISVQADTLYSRRYWVQVSISLGPWRIEKGSYCGVTAAVTL